MSEGNNQYTEVTSKSWFSRISESIKGIVIGFILIIAGSYLLFWNEGRSVKRYKALKEGAGAVIPVAADKVDPTNDGKLIHISDTAQVYGEIADSTFGISGEYVRLRRNVEMFQWEEESESSESKKLGGGTETVTTYTYKKVWSNQLISSSSFKKQGYTNPSSMPIREEEKNASEVTVGAFVLSKKQISNLRNFEKLPLNDWEVPSALGQKYTREGEHLVTYEIGAEPKIGDVRISFSVVKPGGPVSIVAKQVKDTFEPYYAKNGGAISLIEEEYLSADAMFESAQNQNAVIKWLLRVIGFLLIFFGFGGILRPISVLADVIPFLGNIAEAGISLVSLLATTIISFLIIAIAWIYYRPVLAVSLILVAIGAAVYFKMKVTKKTS